jgi:hydrogenase-4 component B
VPTFAAALLLLLLGGVAAVALQARPSLSQAAGQLGAVVGSVLGLAAATEVLVGATPETATAVWHFPGGGLHIAIDALSAFFLLPVFGLSVLTAIYGRAYLAGRRSGRALAASWLNLNLLTAGMALTVTAQDGLLFLVAWEIMALAPFFLVAFDDREASARHAAWTYLAATHLGTAFLLVLFVWLGELAGTSDFNGYAAALRAHPDAASALFLLALIGFGAKAGIVPAHVWLPEAHPAAPSHASALMSGAMIKVGIYGLIRILTVLGPPPPWWGWLLIAVGAAGAVLGVLFALAQHDLKRLLAYSSVENVGIMLLGLGLGVLGLAEGMMPLAVIGFAGALLHVLNHSVFKGLLFLGAGAVQHAAHALELEQLGGLLQRMPWTGAAFLIGSAAVIGLPPLNGFVSEFLLFYAGFFAVTQPGPGIAVSGLAALAALGLVSGLATACFARAFGIVFLGAPRSAAAAAAHEAPAAMWGPIGVLALICIALGLAAPAAAPAMSGIVAAAAGVPVAAVHAQLAEMTRPLGVSVTLFAGLIALAALGWAVRGRLLARHGFRRGPVWGCGFPTPTARMQYTASSFAQPLVTQFNWFVRTYEIVRPARGYFPTAASYASHSGDPFLRLVFAPAFRSVDRFVSRMRIIQHGHVHLYVLYVAVTLVALLIWGSL